MLDGRGNKSNGPGSMVVYEGDELDLSDGTLAEVDKPILNARVMLGADVTIESSLQGGVTYYAKARIELTEESEKILELYEAIDVAYTLKTIGFSKTKNIVRITVPEKRFGYDQELNYLGTTDELLSIRGTYYLSTIMLDIQQEEAVA